MFAALPRFLGAVLPALCVCFACSGNEGESKSANRAACKKFGYVASGSGCEGSCSSVDCTCAGGGSRSVGGCTLDGCVIEADCEAVCAAATLEEAIDCIDTYRLDE